MGIVHKTSQIPYQMIDNYPGSDRAAAAHLEKEIKRNKT